MVRILAEDGDVLPRGIRERLGALGVRSDGAVRLGPWNVARISQPGHPLPPTVIVKWCRPELDATTATEMLDTERRALVTVAAAEPGLVPEVLLAGDDLLVLEDVAGHSLHDLLLAGAGPSATQHQVRFAVAMARMHAATSAGRSGSIEAGIALGPVVARVDGVLAVAERVASDLDQPLAAARAELRVVAAHLQEPGPFLALSNGDPGANNFVVTDDGGRIIDFERAHRRHALEDAAALLVQHSVWMTIERPGAGVVDAYRAELARHIGEAEDDDAFFGGLAAAATSRALDRLGRTQTLHGRPPGHPSRPQLVATLDSAVASLAELDRLPALGGWLAAVGRELRGRWPDADRDFPDAFTV